MQIYLLDPYGQLVPLGVTGEIYIGGVGVAHGYLNRPDLTSERFIVDPYNPQTETRLYKTGDMARYLPDGNIQFIGRTDFQFKIRGFRIEPGEIEAALRCHSAVQEGVVLALEDNPGERRLVSYIVSRQNQGPTVDELRNFLGKKLPSYMVPSTFIFLKAIPLTPNGKIDRKALPKPDTSRPTLAISYATPETEIEQIIATIWQEVLGLDRVGRHDNFFDLGGHSLRMVQVHSRLKAQFDQDLSMANLFEYPTIAAMARFFGQDQNETSDRLSKRQQIHDRAARQKMARTRKRQQHKTRRKQG
jgi:acyl carrier protein